MTAFTISTRTNTPKALLAADTLFVTSLGSVIVNLNNQAAVTGTGNNQVIVDGVITQNNTGSGIELNGGNNAVLIDPTGFVFAQRNGIIIFNAGAGKPGVVYNYGEVLAQSGHAISATGDGSTVKLFSGSTTIGFDIGVEFNTGSTLDNAGFLQGTGGAAVQTAAAGNLVINSGTIIGQNTGIQFGNGVGINSLVNSGTMRSVNGPTVSDNGNMNIVNSGTMDGASGVSQGVTGTLNMINSGYLYGRTGNAITSGNQADTIINNGFMRGDFYAVDLGDGNDFFDGRNGYQLGIVSGGDGNDALFGGAGNDMFYGGNGDDQLMGNGAGDLLDGGGGNDYARYDGGGAVTASLATPAANSGDAAGDTYVSIEGLIGSNAGDLLVGDANANTLFGLGGADGIAGGDGNDTIYGGDGGDSIAGQNGNDIIYGQAGGDVLSGGAGADLFVYTALGDGGDYISDWNVGGTLDKIDFRPLFDLLGYAGVTPRQDGILVVAQNGADTDVSVNGTFMLRLGNTNAATVTDATSFIFQ